MAQDRAGWHKLVTEPPFKLGKPFVRQPRGGDTRVHPEHWQPWHCADQSHGRESLRRPGTCREWKETPPQTKTFSYSIMNCFQHTPEPCGALHSPCGGASQRENISPQTRPQRLQNTRKPNHSSALHFCACPKPPLFRLTPCALHTHAHLTPKHWLLCHLG
jgi:hypothetical protein